MKNSFGRMRGLLYLARSSDLHMELCPREMFVDSSNPFQAKVTALGRKHRG